MPAATESAILPLPQLSAEVPPTLLLGPRRSSTLEVAFTLMREEEAPDPWNSLVGFNDRAGLCVEAGEGKLRWRQEGLLSFTREPCLGRSTLGVAQSYGSIGIGHEACVAHLAVQWRCADGTPPPRTMRALPSFLLPRRYGHGGIASRLLLGGA
eukprot:scaffold87969_cov31-Tisochrysis_lutea.AAC.7